MTCVIGLETPPGLWQLNTEFLVERSTGTLQARLIGEASLEGVLHGSSGENSYSPPSKKRIPQSNGAKKRPAVVHDGERVLQQL